jgi:hypothetical protein
VLPLYSSKQGITSPALAGIVHGVVVHIARQILGRNSSSNPDLDGLVILNAAYMLLET